MRLTTYPVRDIEDEIRRVNPIWMESMTCLHACNCPSIWCATDMFAYFLWIVFKYISNQILHMDFGMSRG